MKAAQPIIYLDNNATTPLHPLALAAVCDALENHFGNPSSSTHKLGWYANELTTIARERVAKLIGAQANEIFFTSGATEANNLALKGIIWPRLRQQNRAHVITAATEHHAVLEPLKYLQSQGLSLTILPTSQTGEIDLDQLRSAITPDTVMVSLMAANNEVGTLHDIQRIGQLARENHLLFHCDATQAIGKIPLSVQSTAIDLLSFSAHKIYGPKGVGALYLRGDTRRELEPLFHGGEQEWHLRPGTLNVPGIVGFGVAAEELVTNQTAHVEHLVSLTSRFMRILEAEIGAIQPNGPAARLPGNLNFSIPGVSSASLITLLANKIAFSTSAACSSVDARDSHVLLAIGATHERIQGAVRLGFGWFNTSAEIEQASNLFASAVKKLRQ